VAEERLQRRLAAILSADVVGYSRLMGIDEAGTLARLKAMRRDIFDPLIAAHSGRTFKLMGDGALVEFGSAVDAVTCAIEVQKQVRDRSAGSPEDSWIQFRIGINVGDIIVDGDDIYGDGVNVAARIQALDPGGIYISRGAAEQVRDKVPIKIETRGEQTVKNIARPIEVFCIVAEDRDAIVAAVREAETRIQTPMVADKPSVAVLPFQNMSGDQQQEYFADGIVEDIITALSRFRQLFVIARNSSFTYKGRAVDVKQVGRELGVRYVLEGSVRKAANRVRITGQLIDTSNGTHLWADRFDGGIEDIFDLQDQVTASVVGAIAPKLEQAEIARARRKRSDSLDAYDLYLRALPHVHANSLDEMKLALPLLEKALAIDPDYAIAHAYAAWCREQMFTHGGHDADDRSAALRHARAALARERDDSSALAIGGFIVAMLDRDFSTALHALDQSLALNGNSALAYGFSAMVRAMHDDYDTGIEQAERALRLGPFDPLRRVPQMALAVAYFLSGNFERAAAVAADARLGSIRYAIHVASMVRLGKLNEANMSVTRLVEAAPDFTVAGSERTAQSLLSRPELVAAISSALTEAGLPRGYAPSALLTVAPNIVSVEGRQRS
jgi:adenylate cyclase